MIKVEVIKEFSLGKFDELKNIKRADENKKEKGMLYINDTFECTKEMADYLTGNNDSKVVVVKVIEVIPEEVPTIKDVDKALKRIHESAKEEVKLTKLVGKSKITKKSKKK